MRELIHYEPGTPGATRDPSGLRFKENRIVSDLLAHASSDEHKLDLNRIWHRFAEGRYNSEEMKEFYQMIGYSLFGYWEVFCFNNDEENSRGWTDKDQELVDNYLGGTVAADYGKE